MFLMRMNPSGTTRFEVGVPTVTSECWRTEAMLPNKSLQVSRDCVSFIKSLFSQVSRLARPPEL